MAGQTMKEMQGHTATKLLFKGEKEGRPGRPAPLVLGLRALRDPPAEA